MKVGIVGLGAIGAAVARNVVAAGFQTIVWNRSREPVERLVAYGATGAANVADVFACDVVLSVLFDDAAVRQVILESDVLSVASRGTVHVCMSTISTGLVADLVAAHTDCGLDYVAAPVFGVREVAESGKLAIATAGPAAVLDRIEPVLRAAGTTWRMGDDPRLGHLAKIAGNFMIFSAVETMRETAAVIEAQGGDPAPFLAMMGETLFAAPIYRSYGARIAAGTAGMRPEGRRIALKDIGLMLAEAETARSPMPLADLIRDQMWKAG